MQVVAKYNADCCKRKTVGRDVLAGSGRARIRKIQKGTVETMPSAGAKLGVDGGDQGASSSACAA